MRFYIATSLSRAEEAKALGDALIGEGWARSYDWTVHGSVQDEGPEGIAKAALAEMEGVKAADMVIVLLPGGRGTHVELGIAIALGLRVLVLYTDEANLFAGSSYHSAFYYAPGVVRLPVSAVVVIRKGSAVGGSEVPTVPAWYEIDVEEAVDVILTEVHGLGHEGHGKRATVGNLGMAGFAEPGVVPKDSPGAVAMAKYRGDPPGPGEKWAKPDEA